MRTLRIDPEKTYLLKPEYLWDGLSADLQKGVTLLVSRGRIKKVLTEAEAVPVQNRNVTLLDFPGLTLMPGLIDCHVHLAFDSENLAAAIEEWTVNPDNTWNRLLIWMSHSLNHGIVAVRDGGDRHSFALKAAFCQKKGLVEGPRVVATGSALYRKGHYGSFLGKGIDSLKDARQEIKNLHEQGIDQLKIVISGLVSFKTFGEVGKLHFTAEELRPIVQLAHNYGLKVMAHASSEEAVQVCLAAQVDSIEHGYFLTEDSLKRMAEEGVNWIPTVAPLGNLLRAGREPYPGADLNVIKRSFEMQLTAINKAAEYGVKLGVGTDAGANQVFHGVSYLNELDYYLQAGLTPLQVLTCATVNSAAILASLTSGESSDVGLGTIKAGKGAALIGVRGNPLLNVKCLREIALVTYL